MEYESLAAELITDASMWRLAIEIRNDSIEVAILSLLHDNSLIRRTIPITSQSGTLSGLSAAVYDNPLLLSDFGKTDILVDTPRFTMVPKDIRDEDVQALIMSTLWTDDEYSILTDEIPHCDDMVLWELPDTLLSFLRRTFHGARIMHRLTPMLRYFFSKERLNSQSKMYAHVLSDRVDIVLIANGKLQVVNSFEAHGVNDMAYYILNVANATGTVIESSKIMVCGNPAVREPVMNELRRYVSMVMPVVFPSSMLSMGKEIMTAPFELIILPLCE